MPSFDSYPANPAQPGDVTATVRVTVTGDPPEPGSARDRHTDQPAEPGSAQDADQPTSSRDQPPRPFVPKAPASLEEADLANRDVEALALKYLYEHTPFGEGKAWDGDVDTLEGVLGVPRTEAFAKLQEVLGREGPEVTRILWETYDPQYYTWLPFAAIGVVAAIALAVFGQMAKRWSDMNA